MLVVRTTFLKRVHLQIKGTSPKPALEKVVPPAKGSRTFKRDPSNGVSEPFVSDAAALQARAERLQKTLNCLASP
jgi:hypothetical protein